MKVKKTMKLKILRICLVPTTIFHACSNVNLEMGEFGRKHTGYLLSCTVIKEQKRDYKCATH